MLRRLVPFRGPARLVMGIAQSVADGSSARLGGFKARGRFFAS